MRKILALILTLTMVLGLAVTAFADTTTETAVEATIKLELTVEENPENETHFEFPSSLDFDIYYNGALAAYEQTQGHPTFVTVSPEVGDTVTATATVFVNIEYEVTEGDEAATADAKDAAIAAELEKFSFNATVVPNFAVAQLKEADTTSLTYTEKKANAEPEPGDPGETDEPLPHDATQAHTITINNPDQNVDHTYKAYQVFKGDLNDVESVLSNIVWGDGVDGDAIIDVLNAAIADGEKPEYLDDSEWDAFVTEAQAYAEAQKPDDWDDEEDGEWTWEFAEAYEVADFISGFTSTNGVVEREDVDTGTEDAGLIDTFAAICADNVDTAAGSSTQDANDPTVYTIPVTGDGYYLVIDETTALNDEETLASDTVSKYLLQVIRDREINAKDTGLNPDKKILNEEEERVAADSANIGDTVTFSVEITVPDTRKYVDHFVFIMNDQLPEGLTYSDNLQIDIGGETFDNIDMYINDDVYILDGELADEETVLPEGAALFTDYDPAYAVAEDLPEYFVTQEGGQAIKVNFNDFKAFVEENELIGETITITYTAVVNDDAVFGPTGNENEVKFDYSSDPNNDYDGDDFDDDDPQGHTPSSTTTTYVTTMKLNKVDGETSEALEGAEFAITYDKVNYYKLTGERFIEDYNEDEHTPEDIWVSTTTTPEEGGEATETWAVKSTVTIEMGTDGPKTYWALNDGSYTDTDPTTDGINDTQYKKVDGEYVTAVKATFVEYVEGDPEEGTITVTTGADGVIHVEGVEAGTYTIKEIKAPDGYNTLKETLEVKIGWIDPDWATTTDEEEAAAWEALSPEQQEQAKTTGGFYIVSYTENAVFTWNAELNAWEITIENNKGTELPSTGGIGTTIFYIVGGLLAVGAGVVLVAKKRMGKVED